MYGGMTGFFLQLGLHSPIGNKWPFPSDSYPPKSEENNEKRFHNEDNYFLSIHLVTYSEFSLFPELRSIEKFCENDYVFSISSLPHLSV